MVNFQKIEEKWQKRWEKEKIFEANPDKRKKFFVTVPYPYTSGPFHIGHGRTYTIADIFARYHRMKGENVLWPMGFHVTGTPVLAISKRIETDEECRKLFEWYVSLHSKNAKEIVKGFINPENVMNYFASTFLKDFKKLGLSIDWRRKFTTNDKEYNKFIEWQFQKLMELGFLKKGKYPVLYCPSCKNAVGEDDIKSGDVIKPEVGEWCLLKFKFNDKYIVCATLRPETIYGVTNIWINPDSVYVEAKVDGEIWIISKDCAEKISFQKNVEILKEFLGKELIGKIVESPNGKDIPIFEGDFVDSKSGSGLVYSVPAHAPYDWIALKDLKKVGKGIDIKPISIIEIKGYSEFPARDICEKYGIKNQKEKEKLDKATEEIYKEEFYSGVLKENCGEFSGKKISEIKDEIVKKFESEGKISKVYDVFATEKPVFCKCGTEIVVSILEDQWFIDYKNKEWKKVARKCLEKIEIIPNIYKKLFEDTIEWLRERPAARKRGLGTKLPFDKNWIIEPLSDSTIYMAFYTIAHKIKKISPEKLTLKFWDYIFLGKGEINDKEIEEMRKEFNYWYPLDLRHTGISHITNHLSFFIFNHVAIFPEKHWPKRITINELLIREGRKMSKSLGNVIPLIEVLRKYGADLYRFYISYGADLSTVFNWREAEIISLRNKLSQFYNLIVSEKGMKYDKNNAVRWLLSRFNKNLKRATEALEKYSPREYIQHAFFNIINDINYFKRRSPKDSGILKEIFPEWIKILSPVIPHICEELWELIGNKTFVSIERWPKFNQKLIDENAEFGEEFIKNLVKDINEVIKLVGKPNKIKIFIASEWKFKLYDILKKEIKKTRDFKKIISNLTHFNIRDVEKIVKTVLKKGTIKYIERKMEKEILDEAKSFLEKEFGCKFEIIFEEESSEEKARNSLPGKPAILVEK